MKKYEIRYSQGKEKERNIAMWVAIRDYGKHIKGEWNGDYWVATYKFGNETYELWENMEYGVMSRIIEKEEL